MTDYSHFVAETLALVGGLPPRQDVLGEVLRCPDLQRDGTWVEFGVASGATLRRIVAERGDARVWGFDSFDGLPEDWRPDYRKGAFASDIPRIAGAHLVTGLFQDTLPAWQPSEPITLVHIDCDLYSAAKCALSHVRPMLAHRAIIVFDELLHYPGFENHELRALYEVAQDGLRYDWLVAGGPESWPSERAALIVRSVQ